MEEYKQRVSIIHKERAVLNEDITTAFTKIRKRNELADYVQVITLLEHLRKSLADEATEWTTRLMYIIEELLKPIQTAQFLLKIEFTHASVTQLSSLWNAISQTKPRAKFSVAQ